MKRRIALTCVLLLLCAGLLSGCGDRADMTLDGSLLTDEPSFWDWEQDGVAMQVIAIRDPDGAVRLAYNTCQSCKGSPYAYFEYLGDGMLQCQNCMLTFPASTVGVAHSGGCNPYTITSANVDGDVVTIPGSVLAKGKKLFETWKVFD